MGESQVSPAMLTYDGPGQIREEVGIVIRHSHSGIPKMDLHRRPLRLNADVRVALCEKHARDAEALRVRELAPDLLQLERNGRVERPQRLGLPGN